MPPGCQRATRWGRSAGPPSMSRRAPSTSRPTLPPSATPRSSEDLAGPAAAALLLDLAPADSATAQVAGSGWPQRTQKRAASWTGAAQCRHEAILACSAVAVAAGRLVGVVLPEVAGSSLA